jgi:hypothetical protein
VWRGVRLAQRFLLPFLFFLLACLFLWPLVLHPNFVPFAPRAQFSDLLITHLPNAAYVREALSRYGQLPLWNTQIFAGQPFAADPLAGLWYPPNWLTFWPALPLPLAFNLLLAAHLAWAGGGLFGLLRAEGLRMAPAFLGALAFMGTPKLVAHVAAGHISLVCAVAWSPWLLLAVRRAATGGGLKRGALAGAMLALIFLADVRWAFYMGVVGTAFWASRLAWGQVGGRGSQAALAFAITFLLLIAILALPLGQFLLASNRQALTLPEAAEFSLPWIYLLGLIIPDLGGFHEWMTYVGVIPLLLSLVGIRRRTLFWLAAIGIAIGFSLGSNFPLFPLLFRALPGVGFLRVPPRTWFVVALGVCILAAYGVQRLADDILPRISSFRSPLLARFLLPALLLFTLADLLRVDGTLLEARPMPPRAPAAEWIAAQPGLFRVYSPSYSLPLGDGLEHVDGVDPLQLRDSVRFIEEAIGVRAASYSVTLPAFAGDDVATANAGAIPDAWQLGLLNVKYIAAEFPLDVRELKLVYTLGHTRVYENSAFRPRAWTENGAAEVVERTPNRLRIQAEGPGLLVISEVVYPGWRASVNGVSAPIETVEGILRGVRIGSGPQDVVLEFRPGLVYAGAAFTLLGLALLLLSNSMVVLHWRFGWRWA